MSLLSTKSLNNNKLYLFTGYTECHTKECIAYQLSLDKEIQRQIKVMFAYQNYVDDIIQDLILQILTTNNPDKIILLAHQNNLNWFIFSVLKNQKKDFSSRLNKNYTGVKEFKLECNDNLLDNNLYIIDENKEHIRYIVNLIIDELKKIEDKNWYSAKIFSNYTMLKKQYEEEGKKMTFEEFGRKMNINHTSLFKVISKVKKQLKNKIKNEL